jgi:hypothetical protein
MEPARAAWTVVTGPARGIGAHYIAISAVIAPLPPIKKSIWLVHTLVRGPVFETTMSPVGGLTVAESQGIASRPVARP